LWNEKKGGHRGHKGGNFQRGPLPWKKNKKPGGHAVEYGWGGTG